MPRLTLRSSASKYVILLLTTDQCWNWVFGSRVIGYHRVDDFGRVLSGHDSRVSVTDPWFWQRKHSPVAQRRQNSL